MFEIDLEWALASEYVLRPVRRGSMRDLAICPAKDAKITRYKPLEQNTALYAEFANLDGSKKACLEFAHKYGLLQTDLLAVYDPEVLEVVERLAGWRSHIARVKEIIKRCELSRANPSEAFRQFVKKDEWLFPVDLYLSVKSPKSPAALDVRTTSLLSAIELQAIQSILEGYQSRQCIECTKLIKIGVGERRSHSKFCSTRCKDKYHNRLKAEARRDHA
jgi:hypothetical protein